MGPWGPCGSLGWVPDNQRGHSTRAWGTGRLWSTGIFASDLLPVYLWLWLSVSEHRNPGLAL